MTPKNKPRIYITLHARGRNSVGEKRTRLKHSAYHWGILISPKEQQQQQRRNKDQRYTIPENTPALPVHTHFDVTDSLYIDVDGQAKENWRYRERNSTDPVLDFRILARVLVGKVHFSSSPLSIGSRFRCGYEAGTEIVREKLSAIPVPCPRGEVGVKGTPENCVTWTKDAIRVLKDIGVVGLQESSRFDLEVFMDAALEFADECLRRGDIGGVLDYRAGTNLE
ncbi:hypothetical protein BDV18DRAFT_160311 [Aspergillus unguis]